MSFQPDKMRKLIEHDRFLSSAYEDVRRHFLNDEEALYYLFNQYVKNEPIFQNAYHILTD